MPRRSKYRNRQVAYGGHQFHSKAEGARYLQLLERQQNNEISDLTCQPGFLLIEGFRDNQGKKEIEVKYTADFQYIEGGLTVVEEVKSKATAKARDYPIRRKLFKRRYPHIVFREVIVA